MNYEEKYKEALERARKSFENSNGMILKKWLWNIFPELKESEDERIRKAIIEIIKSQKEQQCHIDGAVYDEMLTWLEKQGESIDKEKVKIGARKDLALSIINYLDDNRVEGCMDLSSMECEDIEDACVNSKWTKLYNYMKKKLEKQDESNPYSGVSFEYKGHIWGMCARDNGVDIMLDKQLLKHLEAQGEQPTEFTYTHIVETGNGNTKALVTKKVQLPKFKVGDTILDKHYRWAGSSTIKEIKDGKYIFNDGQYIDIEKQNNWELVDENKSKFKVGDWIIGVNSLCKITSLNDELSCYIAFTTSNEEVKIPYYFDDGYGHMCSYHLWTIQDAKDGDILVTHRRQPFIFNGHYDEDTDYVYAYCGISDMVKDDSFYANEEGDEEFNIWCEVEGVCPATKEQRNLLFQKMKESGYEWDADKKELKII